MWIRLCSHGGTPVSFIKPWPGVEVGGHTRLSLLCNPGKSAPSPKSLPCHRTTSTKDGDHHEDLYLLGAPILPSDVPEGKSLAWWWRTPQEEEGPARDTADLVNILSPGLLCHVWCCQGCTKALLSRSKPREGLTPLLWLNTLLDPHSRERRPQVPQSQPGSYTYPCLSQVSWPTFKRKPDSFWFHINWSQSHISSLLLTGMVLNLTLFLTDSPAQVEWRSGHS